MLTCHKTQHNYSRLQFSDGGSGGGEDGGDTCGGSATDGDGGGEGGGDGGSGGESGGDGGGGDGGEDGGCAAARAVARTAAAEAARAARHEDSTAMKIAFHNLPTEASSSCQPGRRGTRPGWHLAAASTSPQRSAASHPPHGRIAGGPLHNHHYTLVSSP